METTSVVSVDDSLFMMWLCVDQGPSAKAFTKAKKERVGELLATLAAIGKAPRLDDGRPRGGLRVVRYGGFRGR